ncbi:BolA family protein [Oryzibacter oryziterrae]|uniref:BolA family protein n=1 Tax=Oryzibacter oryziterrae TaxID=2766474 RepID=UPI001F330302|nr:BolA family protein [Oryzibacter oryziterrae]
MSRADRMQAALEASFAPSHLVIEDESARHHGHAGHREGGETHYRIEIESAVFAGRPRVACHRLVTESLAAEFQSGLHALSLVTRAPSA